MRWFYLCSVGICLSGLAPAAHAAMSGTLALRGIVTARAVVRIANASPRMAIDLSGGSSGKATFRLTQLANSAAGFTVSLDSDSVADGQGLVLLGDDGSKLPYQVRFAGKAVALGSGETQLANVTRDTEEESGEFEIVTPSMEKAKARRYEDRLVLTVKAR